MAFGMIENYTGSSRAYPFSESIISLFIPSEDSLVQVLENFKIANYNGEWDTNCEGEFLRKEGILTVSKDKTNGFNDIVVNYKYTTQTSTIIDDDCVDKEKITHKSETLKFIEGTYK